MTTVIDPGTGGEAVVFNKSGTAILNVSLTDSFTMTVPHIAERIILSLSFPQTGPDPTGWSSPVFTVGSDFEIGDEVWIVAPFSPRGARFDLLSNLYDSAGNQILGGFCIGVVKVANAAEVLITDGETPVTNWKALSVISAAP